MSAIELSQRLELRRRAIGMTKKRVAERSGLSLPTVNRILSGQEKRLSYAALDALARTLGVVISLGAVAEYREIGNAFEVRQKQAEAKARDLMGMIQGTMGLEAQAVSDDTLDQMIKQTTSELLAGSPNRLWSA